MNKRVWVLVLLVLLVGVCMLVLALDFDWCYHNGGPLLRCVWYENSFFGRWISPPIGTVGSVYGDFALLVSAESVCVEVIGK